MKQPSGTYSNLFDDDDFLTEEDQDIDAELQVRLWVSYGLPCGEICRAMLSAFRTEFSCLMYIDSAWSVNLNLLRPRGDTASHQTNSFSVNPHDLLVANSTA